MNKTIFVDIDGTLIKHQGGLWEQSTLKPELLPGAREKLLEWERKNYKIILTTGRRESLRSITEKQLLEVGIYYDILIMGLGRGDRILINDTKIEDEHSTAIGITVLRNQGIENIDV